jgi:hypothetical protein
MDMEFTLGSMVILTNNKLGDKYEGEFKNCLKHGIGTESFANGDIYNGNYLDGKPDGYGKKLNVKLKENITGNQEQFIKVSSAKDSDTAKELISRSLNRTKTIKENTKTIAKADLGCRLTRMEVNTLVCLKTTFDTVKEK